MQNNSFARRWQDISQMWNNDFRWLYILAGFGLGLVAFPAFERTAGDFLTLLYDLVPEVFGIIITVMVIDNLYEGCA
jgi:hypothetical protein